MLKRSYLIVGFLLTAWAGWAQDDFATQPAASAEDRMVVPTPVSNQAYSTEFGAETPRTNYLRMGLTFGSAYDDNVFMTADPVHDVTYSVGPTISLQQSRSLTKWGLTYSPGFTFYQHYDSRQAADHNVSLQLERRLSPHVTLTVLNDFVKTSNVYNQIYATESPSAASQAPPDAVISPVTNRWSNVSSAEVSYQFAPNAMVGMSGNFSELRYLDRVQASGLYDSSAQAAKAFYTHRLTGRHYIGTSYGFQRLLTYPGDAETQTHSVLLFYTLYFHSKSSLSVFAGPEYSDTFGSNVAPLTKWSPAAGASLGWQGEHTTFSLGVARRIDQGGGLPGAVQSESVQASYRRLLTSKLTVGSDVSYANNTVLSSVSSSGGGHTLSGGVSLERSLGERMGLQIGYTRLHQTYTQIASVPNGQDRNRVWVSVSYSFERPLGR